MMVKELFIDRKENLRSLTHGLKNGKDYILIAPRRYGKTTLAQKILENITQDAECLTIHIDIMRYSGSVQSVAEGIVENCLNALGFIGRLKFLLKQLKGSSQTFINFNCYSLINA